MPTGTKIVAIVLVVLLGVAGLYFMASSPSPNTSKSSAAKESGSNSTNSGTSVGNTPPTLTLTPGVAGNTGIAANGATGSVASNGVANSTANTGINTGNNNGINNGINNGANNVTGGAPAPTGALATGTAGGARSQPAIIPGAAAPSGTGKGDGTVAASADANSPAKSVLGASGVGGTSNFNGIATTNGGNGASPRLSNGLNRSAPGVGGGTGSATGAVATGANTTATGGPAPTGAGLPTGNVPAGLTSGSNTGSAAGTLATNSNGASQVVGNSGERIHIIASGDTFEALAQKYYGSGSKAVVISKANPTLEPTRLRIGQKVRIPAEGVSVSADASAATTTGSGSTGSVANAGNGSFHVVAKGDTPSSISRKYFGSDKYWRQILAANKGATEKNLKIGQKLVIPTRETVVGAENTGRSGS